ncbi:MAG TPA: chemotaxis protein CheW [Vicinamibacterales bacterium]|nr:chemotaxis protein CheW [Vicinamibacterales bacterium]
MHDRAAELRQSFDRSFAHAWDSEHTTSESLLALGIRSHHYAVRMSDVSGLFVDKNVTHLPSPVAALSGLAGFRGTVLPIYDLGLLLGHPKAAAPRWLIVTAGTPVGLAFDAFDGHLRVRPDAIVPQLRAGHGRHIQDVLHADVIRPIVHVASVLASIKSLAPGGPAKEQE